MQTIDLCNNPLTKTPKLDNAVRIIDEWTSLDNEAKAIEDELLQRNQNESKQEHTNEIKSKEETKEEEEIKNREQIIAQKTQDLL